MSLVHCGAFCTGVLLPCSTLTDKILNHRGHKAFHRIHKGSTLRPRFTQRIKFNQQFYSISSDTVYRIDPTDATRHTE